jgi:DNA-binding CsgD family transcriptional regulator
MDFAARPMEETDLPVCLALLEGRLAYPDHIVPSLQRVWRSLLRDDALVGSVIETRTPDGATATVAFGASVFVTDAWAADARSSEEPYLTARTIDLELKGRSPILRPPAIVHGNAADGLNVLILHYGETHDVPPDARPAMRYRMFESFLESHRGYRIKEVLQEFWDELDHEFVVRGWGRVHTDYAEYFARRGEELPPLGRRPHLVGLTREESLGNPGEIAARLFVYSPSRLAMTRAEQRMLAQALVGSTDVELARSLRLAVPTIKSRWRGIYDRVGAIAPELLPERVSVRASAQTRGREKRRWLLEYLRRHPEELRAALCRGRRGRPRK